MTPGEAERAMAKAFKEFETAYVRCEKIANSGILDERQSQDLLDGIRAGHRSARIAYQHIMREAAVKAAEKASKKNKRRKKV